MDADILLDRRRLRRRLSFWRVVAFLAVAVAVIAVIGFFAGGKALIERTGAQIARIEISGVMFGERRLIDLIDKVRKSDAVKAVIIAIDSPGGTTAAGESVYGALRELADEKPVVATIDTLGASAGYMAALASERIFARRSAITGSIGVLFQFAQVEELMQTIGVDIEMVTSGELKAQPSPFEPASEEARQLLRTLVADSYDWFVDLVVERRGLSADAVRAGEGRIFTGGQALDAGLIDAIGGEKEAKAWLVAEKDIDEALPIKTWKPKPVYDGLSFMEIAGGWVAGLFGGDARLTLGARMAERIIDERLMLDGLVSVWHASPASGQFSEKGGRQ